MRNIRLKIKEILCMWKERSNREDLYGTVEYWDSKAEKNSGNAVSMWANNNLNYYYHNEVISTINKYLTDVQRLRILDLGCGTGRISSYLADRGAYVTGIDFSPKAIEIARSQTVEENPLYRIQSIHDISEISEYDVAASWGTVVMACRNKRELLEFLKKLKRALKPEGRALLIEPIHKGFLHRVLNMSIKEFCKTLQEAGFAIKGKTNLHFWPMRLALAFVKWPKQITATGYYIGQGIMHVFGNRILGDYIAVYASVMED